MNAYRQVCPSCRRELELPADSVGRLAKCPACETTFRVGESSSASGQSDLGQSDSGQSDSGQSDSASSAELSPTNPFAKPVEENPMGGTSGPAQPSGQPRSAGDPSVSNPYQPATALPHPVKTVGAIEIVQRPIEDIFSPSWSIFKERWSPLILSTLIIIVAVGVLTLVPFVLLGILANGGNEVLGAAFVLIFMPIALLIGAYTTVGLARVALAVARNEPEPMSQLMPPMNLVVRLIVGGAAMIGATMLLFGVFAALAVALAAITNNEGIAFGVGILGVGVMVILSFLAQWLLWPWVFVVSDGKGTALGSINAAVQISLNNKLTSVIVVVISVVLSMVGSSLCYVGQLVTTPFTLLIFAVGYLVLTNQPVSDPAAYQPPANQPPASPSSHLA
ncbi:hypothetical protein CA13_25070 [Planctomycetes bacterium CA13]|uniref:Uncharacterized protein n=1 Tax=Novipirellula herctigrandis TaxID=2527986 RepID=A0A5C5Z1K5_9BACT|nr:hypothetical protein CA13_25070 [Planctomycetes bacterium CA13]